MRESKRVYPAESGRKVLINWLLLITAGITIVTGLIGRGNNSSFSINTVPTQQPPALDERFDETPAEGEIKLPAVTWYALQLGAFEKKQSAVQMAETYKARGAAGFVWEDGRYRTLAAVYPLREDALTVRAQLSEKHLVESYLYEISFPEVQLRLSGMKGQLEILEAAFLHAADMPAFLQKISVQMDQQELGMEDTFSRLDALEQQMSIVSLRLKQRFAAPRPAVVDELIRYMDLFVTFCQESKLTESAVSLGQKVKYQTFATLNQLKKIYETLMHT